MLAERRVDQQGSLGHSERQRKFAQWTYVEGFFFALMVASSESYALLYLTRRGIDAIDLALVTTLPVLLASLSQLYFPKWFSQKTLGRGMLIAITIQLLGLIGLWIMTQWNWGARLAILPLSLFWIGGQNTSPLWLDFVSQRIDEDRFSHYLGGRNNFVAAATVVMFILFAYLFGQKIDYRILFAVGVLARMVSLIINWFLVRGFAKPLARLSEEKENSSSATGKIILYRYFFWGACFRFCVHLSSPFFISYMVNDLRISNIDYVWLTAFPFVGRALFQRNWATASEQGRPHYGVQLSTFFISFLPWAWTLSPDFTFLAVLQIFSGFFWGGMDLSQILMLQFHHYGKSRKMMGIQMAAFNSAATLGALAGGLLLQNQWSVMAIFNLSSAARFGIAIALFLTLRPFHLSRMSLRSSYHYLSTVISIRPALMSLRIIPARPIVHSRSAERNRPKVEGL